MSSIYSPANSVTPTPGQGWSNLGDDGRLASARKVLAEYPNSSKSLLEVTGTKPDGQVIVKFLKSIGPELRGTILLDFEEYLKDRIDPGITVWHEALGDRNSLRNLRGIEVKS